MELEKQTTIPVIVIREDMKPLSTTHTLDAAEVENAFPEMLNQNEQFISGIYEGLFGEEGTSDLDLDPETARARTQRIEITQLNEGHYQYIFRATIHFSDREDVEHFVLATSKGLYSDRRAKARLKGKPQLESPWLPLLLVEEQRSMGQQVWYDFHNLPYLRRIFRQRNVPIRVPQTFAFTVHHAKSQSTNTEQPFNVVAMQLLMPTDGGIGGEINPAHYHPDAQPVDGKHWFWRLNYQDGNIWNDPMYDAPLTQRETMNYGMDRGVAYIQSCVYFATGKWIRRFAPSAGDVLLFIRDIRQLLNIGLGLITTRGSLVKLTHSDGKSPVRESEIHPRDVIPGGHEVQEEPDIGNLFIKLMTTEYLVNNFEFYDDEEQAPNGSNYVFPFQDDIGALIDGLISALFDFYGHTDALNMATFPQLAQLQGYRGTARIAEVIGELYLELGDEQKLLTLYELELLTGQLELLLQANKKRIILPQEPDPLVFDPALTAGIMTTRQINISAFTPQLLEHLFGPSIGARQVPFKDTHLTAHIYEVPPQLVRGMEGVFFQHVIGRERDYGQIYCP